MNGSSIMKTLRMCWPAWTGKTTPPPTAQVTLTAMAPRNQTTTASARHRLKVPPKRLAPEFSECCVWHCLPCNSFILVLSHCHEPYRGKRSGSRDYLTKNPLLHYACGQENCTEYNVLKDYWFIHSTNLASAYLSCESVVFEVGEVSTAATQSLHVMHIEIV